MKFSELENQMNSIGINTYADIARFLGTTPQAVSNWKARDQIPYHVESKLSQKSSIQTTENLKKQDYINGDKEIGISDILVTLAEQLKIILFMPFVSVFLTFTYIMFIQEPVYTSKATILLPAANSPLGAGSGLSGLASQFGVNVPNNSGQADLSSPYLFPDLFSSRTFAEKVLDQEIYSEEYGKTLSLLAIFTYGDGSPSKKRDILIANAMGIFRGMVKLNYSEISFSTIQVTTKNALFSKKLAEVVITQLEEINRYYKSQSVREKAFFIDERVKSVKSDLIQAEQTLKLFRQQNQQVSSPALQLELDRLNRDIDIKKGIYLSLKQQFELAKIEEVQTGSILQVLDKPLTPLGPSNKKIKVNVLIAGVLGIGLGIIIGFIRSFFWHGDIDERRKMRRMKSFLKKKTKNVFEDSRITGVVSLLLIICSPYYLSHRSANPTFFGMYSTKLMVINLIYIFTIILSTILFFKYRKK